MSLPRLCRLMYPDSPVRQSDRAGGFTESWLELGAMWCEVLVRNGCATVQGGAPVSAVSYKVTVRSAPMGHPERPTAGQRFSDGTRHFHIRAVAERAGIGSFPVCFVDEEVAV